MIDRMVKRQFRRARLENAVAGEQFGVQRGFGQRESASPTDQGKIPVGDVAIANRTDRAVRGNGAGNGCRAEIVEYFVDD
jgi:hypothetical protein